MKKILIHELDLINLSKTKSIQEIADFYNCSRATISKKLKHLNIKAKKVIGYKLSEKGRKNMSLAKVKFYKEHPEKHIWKKSSKFKSVPCEIIKSFIKNKQINFIDEFSIPESEKNYSIDIAFPDKKIGIEINGNQHYNKDGTLSEYYKIRHDYIENLGWKLYELHFSIAFHLEEFKSILEIILNSETKITFDYGNYIPKSEIQYKCPKCLKIILKGSKTCRGCSPRINTLELPSKDQLQKLIWEKPIKYLAKDLMCSSSGLIKNCKKLGILFVPKGYWLKRFFGKTHEEIIKMSEN